MGIFAKHTYHFIMKHKLLTQAFFFLLLLLIQYRVLAQTTFSITPNPAYTSYDDTYEVRAEATIKNLSLSTETFRWTRTVLKLENGSGCVTAVGDPFAHYPPGVSTKTFYLDSGQEGPLQVFLFDSDNTGCCAIVNMKVARITGSADSIDVLFYLRECGVLSAPESLSGNAVLSPNPVGDYFSLQNAEAVERIELFDASGKKVRSILAATGRHYWCGDLPSGAYFLVLRNHSDIVLQVLQFSKK